jgi:signal peptidase
MKKTLILVSALLLIALTLMTMLGPWKPYVVKTGSMEPTIPVASTVLVNEDRRPVQGQVVTFSDEGQVTTHRLMPSGATKGDANRAEDPWKLSQTKVLGTVQASVPHLGYLLIFLRQPTGAPSLLLLPLLIRLAWRMAAPAPRRPTASVAA